MNELDLFQLGYFAILLVVLAGIWLIYLGIKKTLKRANKQYKRLVNFSSEKGENL